MMNEKEMHRIMTASVSLICDKLTDEELAALNLVALLGGSPHGRVFDYEKVKALFTDAEGTKMHDETKLALATVVNKRFEKGK